MAPTQTARNDNIAVTVLVEEVAVAIEEVEVNLLQTQTEWGSLPLFEL
jgi:hypothetical protein